MIVGAMAVDLGNAMGRKQQTQNNADFAALAGAADFPRRARRPLSWSPTGSTRTSRPVTATTTATLTLARPITAGMLTDGKPLNGEVTYPTANSIKVARAGGPGPVRAGQRHRHRRRLRPEHRDGAHRVVRHRHDAVLRDHGLRQRPAGAQGQLRRARACPSPCRRCSPTPRRTTPCSPPTASTRPRHRSRSPSSAPRTARASRITGTNPWVRRYIDQVGFFNSDQTAPKIATITAQTATSITVNVPNAVASYQDVW